MNKKQRRISSSAQIYVPLAVLLVIIFGLFGISSFLKILNIEIEGASRQSQDRIIEVSGISIGGNLLWLSTSNAEDRIKEAIPLISEVVVVKQFPDTVRIEVKESRPFAWIRYEREALIIDSEGRIIDITDKLLPGLIEIRGFSPNSPTEGNLLRPEAGGSMRLQFMIDILGIIEDEGIAAMVPYLDVTSIAKITFGYGEHYTVLLGGPEGAQRKISQLPLVIAEAEAQDPNFDPNADYTVDMSDPSGEWRLRR